MPDKIKRRKKYRKPNWDTAPFDMDQSDIDGPDIRYKNDPLHREGPSNTLASRRSRLAQTIVAFTQKPSRPGLSPN